MVREPAPPRRLPSQDHAALDVAERAARQLTWVVGVLALVVAVVVAAAALVVHQW